MTRTLRIGCIIASLFLVVVLGWSSVCADPYNQTITDGCGIWPGQCHGIYEATGYPDGYYSSSKQFSCRMDSTCNLYHYPDTGDVTPAPDDRSGGQMAVTPHNVKFKLTTFTSVPIPEVLVTAKGYETTVGAFDWLYSLIGIDQEKTPVLTSTMSGRTDLNGEIDFMMFETVKYVMTFERAGYVFDPLTVYPHDTFYKVYPREDGKESAQGIWLKGGANRDNTCKMACNVRENADGSACFDVQYMDLSCGSSGTLYLTKTCDKGTKNVVGSCPIGYSDLVYNPRSSSASLAGMDQFPEVYQYKEHTFSVTDYHGGQYSVIADIQHEQFGNFRLESDTSFKPLPITAGLPEDTRIYVAIFLMLFVGMIFGSTSATQGSLVVCFIGWLFYAFGWFDRLGAAAPTALTLATIVSIFAIIMVRSKREQFR